MSSMAVVHFAVLEQVCALIVCRLSWKRGVCAYSSVAQERRGDSSHCQSIYSAAPIVSLWLLLLACKLLTRVIMLLVSVDPICALIFGMSNYWPGINMSPENPNTNPMSSTTPAECFTLNQNYRVRFPTRLTFRRRRGSSFLVLQQIPSITYSSG